MCPHWILIIVEYAWRQATIMLHTPCALSCTRKFWKWELECVVQFILFGFNGYDLSMRAEVLLFFLVLKVPIWKSFFHLKEKFWPCSGFPNHGYGDFLILVRVMFIIRLSQVTCNSRESSCPWKTGERLN
jgi:hypothetical protein